jgi:cell division protein FtsB
MTERPIPQAAVATAERSRPGDGAATGRAPGSRRPPGLARVDHRALRSARRRRRFLTVVTLTLVVALFGVGLAHAQLVQRQQQLDDLRAEIGETHAERLRLERAVVVASSPDEIVRRASEMGMVRALDPVYLVALRPVEGG